MAFGAEQRRLRGIMRPGEQILASDLLHEVVEWPRLSRPPVLVVSDLAVYFLTSGREKGVLGIPFTNLKSVRRRSNTFQRDMQLVASDSDGSLTTVTCIFQGRDRHGLTGDLITERFFGHVVKNTEGVPPTPFAT